MFEFLEYIKSPVWLGKKNQQTLKDKLLAVVGLLIFTYFILLITAVVISLFDHLIVQELLKLPSFLHRSSLILNDLKHRLPNNYAVIIVLIGPLLEELIFRFPLDVSANTISLCLSVIFYRLFVPHITQFNFGGLHDYLILTAAVNCFLTLRKAIPKKSLKTLKNNYYPYIFYFSAALFGLVHVTNYGSLSHLFAFLYIVYLLPQFVMGVSIGYARIKYGFVFGLLIHITTNGIFLLSHLR